MANIRTSLPFPTEPWEAAKANFLKGLSDEERSRYKDATLENMFYDASASQKRHAHGSKSWAMQERLTSLVEGISDYGKALDVYVNVYPLVLSPIWGSLRVVLHIASEAGKFQEKLVDMLASIGDALPRFRIYQALYRNHERLLAALSSAYLDILRFCTLTKDFFMRAKKSHIPLAIICLGAWKPFRQQFQVFMDGFREHKSRVKEEAGLAHFIESAKAREIELANQQLQIRDGRINRRHRLIALLPTVDYQAKHQRLIRTRQVGTNQWIKNHPVYKSWSNSKNSDCICCYGIPGSGKSVLAASVVEHVSACDLGGAALCYFYCDYTDASSLDPFRLIASLVKQLLVLVPLETFDEEFFRSLEESSSISVLCDIGSGLPRLLKYFNGAYMILDGLDELSMEGQRICLAFLKELLQHYGLSVRIFITSRREEHLIRSALEGFKAIDLSTVGIDEDIALFVEATIDIQLLDRSPVFRKPNVRQDVIQALVDGAKGMFLWVKFQLHDLSEALTEAAVYATLVAMPKDLDQTYARIIQRIYDTPGGKLKIETMIGVFRWVLCARRPLHIEELEEAVALQPTDTYLHMERVATEAGDKLVSACGNLVNYDRTDGTVTFAHHTVQQYLYSHVSSSRFDNDNQMVFDRIPTEVHIGEICVAYLCFSDFETQLVKTETPTSIDRPTAENIIWDHVPMSTQLRKIVRTFSPWGESPANTTNPSIKFAIPVPAKSGSPGSLAKKYAMLDYVIEHWLSHTSHFSEGLSSWGTFKKATFTLQLGFEFRPWNLEQQRHSESPQTIQFPWFPAYAWAIKRGSRSLLKLFSTDQDLMGQLVHMLKTEPIDNKVCKQIRRHDSAHDAILSVVSYSEQDPTQDNFWTSRLIYQIASSREYSTSANGDSPCANILQFLREEFMLRSDGNSSGHIDRLFDASMLLAAENRDALAMYRLLSAHIFSIRAQSQLLVRMVRQRRTDHLLIQILLTFEPANLRRYSYLQCFDYRSSLVEDDLLSDLGDTADHLLSVGILPDVEWLKNMGPFFKWVIAVRLLAQGPDRASSASNEIVVRRFLMDEGAMLLAFYSRGRSPEWNIFDVALQRAHAHYKGERPSNRRLREMLLVDLIKTGVFNPDETRWDVRYLLQIVECRMDSLVGLIMPGCAEAISRDPPLDSLRLERGRDALRTAMMDHNPCLAVMLEWPWSRRIVQNAIEGGIEESVPYQLRQKLFGMA